MSCASCCPGWSWRPCRRGSSCRRRTATPLPRSPWPRRARRVRRPARPRSPTTPGSRPRGSGGRPGIHSARYAGEGASDEENLAKLLREVAAAGDERRAAYVCALALIEADGAEHVFEARCEGRLVDAPRGEGGFGYDPAFVPDDTGPEDERTMSELSQAEKNEISHRGRAARLLAGHLGAGAGCRRRRDDPHQKRRRGALDRLQRAADRDQARRRGDHRLDRDRHRGGPLADRPGRLGRRLRLGAQGRRARRRRAPLRAREGREPGGDDRGDADPGRRRDHRLRGDPPAGGRRQRSNRSASASR